jgi:hypothetical protein
MTEAREDYDARMSGIQNYMVSQTSMGMTTSMYFERHEVDGWVVFLPDPAKTTLNGETMDQAMGGQDVGSQMDSNYYLRPEVMDRARIDGSLEVDGHDCWIIVLDDFDGLDLGMKTEGAGGGFEPRVLRMYLDKDEYMARRLDFDGTITMGAEPQEMSTSALMTDYREVDGMLYPFRVEIETDMGQGSADDTEAGGSTPAAMQAMIDQMGADLSDAERAMIEGLMQNDQGGLQAMMNQAMSSIIIETTELKVNAGPPGGDQ